jgi:hypothetical protein
MADLTRIASPSFDGSNPTLHKITGLVAGEALLIGDLVYVKSDGKVWKAVGAAATAPAKTVGMVGLDCSVGEAATILCRGWRWNYSTGLTPGAKYYVSGTAGLLSDAATTGGTTPVAFAVSATDIVFSDFQN